MKSLKKSKSQLLCRTLFFQSFSKIKSQTHLAQVSNFVIKHSGFNCLFFMFVWLFFKATRQFMQFFLRQNCSSSQCQEAFLSIWHSTTYIQSQSLVQIINKCSALFSKCINFSLIRQAQLSSAKQNTLQTKRKHFGY